MRMYDCMYADTITNRQPHKSLLHAHIRKVYTSFHTRTRVYKHIYIPRYVHTVAAHPYMHARVHELGHAYIHTYLREDTHTHTFIHPYKHAYTRIHTYLHTHVQMQYAHTHTHTHISTYSCRHIIALNFSDRAPSPDLQLVDPRREKG